MSKITLDSVASGYDLSKINTNFQTIQNELNDKVLYRNNPVGETNTLLTTVDCNARSLYNLPTPTLSHQVATKGYVDTAPTSAAASALASAAAARVSETNAAASAASAAAAVVTVSDQKIVWMDAWSGATAYAVNDAVSSGGNSYICILAHTNNVPPNATYWSVLAAKGAAGAGTGDMLAANNLSDLANKATSRTTLGVQIGADVQAYDPTLSSVAGLTLTQGCLFTATGADAAAVLAKGTASQQLRMNVGATAPEWFTAASASTLITVTTFTSNGTWNINGSTTKIIVMAVGGGGGGYLGSTLPGRGGQPGGINWAFSAAPASSYAITIGAGGGSSASGGSTTVGALLTAVGGNSDFANYGSINGLPGMACLGAGGTAGTNNGAGGVAPGAAAANTGAGGGGGPSIDIGSYPNVAGGAGGSGLVMIWEFA
jgi:hypothetical protein